MYEQRYLNSDDYMNSLFVFIFNIVKMTQFGGLA